MTQLRHLMKSKGKDYLKVLLNVFVFIGYTCNLGSNSSSLCVVFFFFALRTVPEYGPPN